MKTKEFIERVESNLFTVKESTDGTIIFIHPSRNDFNILAWVNKYENESHIYNVLPKDLAESLLAYAMTPIDEREEEKKYVYKLPILSTGSSTSFIQKFFSAIRIASPDKKVYDLTGIYHFTDKEVEQYAGKSRLLFDACEKIEVSE